MVFVAASIPVAEWSKASVCGRSLAGNAGSNPPGHGHLLCFVCFVYFSGLCVGVITR
jgi:hypothetical protein